MTIKPFLSKQSLQKISVWGLFSATSFLPTAFSQPAPAAHTPRGMSDEQIVQDLRSHLDRLVTEDRFSGAVLLAKNHKILFARAYGFADHAFNAPNRVDTKFNLASVGKMFTAVASMQLAQAGKLSLDDTLLKLAPDYPNPEVAAKISIRQLLTHTSGLGDIFGKEYEDSNPTNFQTLESYLPLFAGKPLLFEPGTKYSYSNAGFVVLGLVIERVSGESYYDYVREHIFRLAGMADTGCYSVSDDVPNLALGYTRFLPGRAPGGRPQAAGAPREVTLSFARGSSAGGCYSTVEDMLRFSQALEGHKLLSLEYTNLLMTGQVAMTPDPKGPKNAFGMGEFFDNGIRVVGHAGGAPGASTNLDMYPDLGYTAAVLSNYDDGAGLVNDRLRWELTGRELPRAIDLSPSVLKEFEGKYKAPPPPPGIVLTGELPPLEVLADREGLRVALPMMGIHEFLPLSPKEFFDEDAPGSRLTFTKDEKGQVTGLAIAGRRIHITAPKLP